MKEKIIQITAFMDAEGFNNLFALTSEGRIVSKTIESSNEFGTWTLLEHWSIKSDLREELVDLGYSDLKGYAPSCEKNPADAQPETGVAEPGKKE